MVLYSGLVLVVVCVLLVVAISAVSWFSWRINVTVGIALLVSWAARSNIIAVRVLQQLIAGHDRPAQDWEKVRKRLSYIEKQMKKELKNHQK